MPGIKASWSSLSLMLAVTMAAALGFTGACASEDKAGGAGGTAGDSAASDSTGHDSGTEGIPRMTHGACNEEEGQMCVVCHTCGGDGTWPAPAPIIDRTHGVCNECHDADGNVIIHGEEGCEWTMDCEAIPPEINCDDCHTVREVNHLCEECHL